MNQDHAPKKFRGEFSNNFEAEQICQDLFGDKTNKSPAAQERDREREALKEATPPVDILTLSLAEREKAHYHRVTVPKAVQQRITEATFPLSEIAVEELEDMMMAHHKVENPAFIIIDQDFKSTGKTWRHLPELEKTQTPFIYMHA